MVRNEVIYKIMKDMVKYLSQYQLQKLKTALQSKLEDVEINLKSLYQLRKWKVALIKH